MKFSSLNFLKELREVFSLTREYFERIIKYPKSERDDLTEAIILSFEIHLAHWYFDRLFQLIVALLFAVLL